MTGDHGHPGSGLVLAPFRGVRYAPSLVHDLAAVTSPPYDLVDEDVARFMAQDPYNVVRLILPRAEAARPEERHRRAGTLLRRWLASGVLSPDPAPGLYVYEEDDPHAGPQRGLIGALALRDEASRVVLPHEDVFPGPVRDRLALMRATEANLEPIFLLYEGGAASSPGAASRVVDETAEHREPLLATVTPDGVGHRLWTVTDAEAHAAVAMDLRDRQALIADGHHRYATYRAFAAARDRPGPWDFGLALLVDSRAYPPRLGAIHRVIPGLPVAQAVRRARTTFRVTEIDGRDHALSLLRARSDTAFLVGAGDGTLFLLTDPDPDRIERAMPTDRSACWRGLDTAVLHRFVIPRLWGVDEDDDSVRVVHHDAAVALDRAARDDGTAVILNPLKVPDVLAVAARGEKVPRKSTSFGPKPRTGLVLRTFAEG